MPKKQQKQHNRPSQKEVLFSILNVLENQGINKSSEIAQIGEVLADTRKIGGLRRSLTVERHKAQRQFNEWCDYLEAQRAEQQAEQQGLEQRRVRQQIAAKRKAARQIDQQPAAQQQEISVMDVLQALGFQFR